MSLSHNRLSECISEINILLCNSGKKKSKKKKIKKKKNQKKKIRNKKKKKNHTYCFLCYRWKIFMYFLVHHGISHSGRYEKEDPQQD